MIMSHLEEEEEKPCRACSDFKTWAKKQNKTTLAAASKPAKIPVKAKDCPLDKEELGNNTWGFLHTMASYYPEKASSCQANDMSKFFKVLSKVYPCEPCALDFQEDLKENPVCARSREELEKWLCDRHNTVNRKLGKPEFDCSKVGERWRDGWKDGSCDME